MAHPTEDGRTQRQPLEEVPSPAENPPFGYAKVLALVTQFIDRNQQDQSILNIWGFPGIGKTTFLEAVMRQQRDMGRGEPTLLSATTYITPEGIFDVGRFFGDVALHYGVVAEADRTIAELFAQALNRLDRPPVLIVDDYDSLQEYKITVRVFEELLARTIATAESRPVVILGSNRRIEVNRELNFEPKTVSQELDRLFSGDLMETLPQEYYPVIPFLVEYSGGIPSVVDYLLTRMKREPNKDWENPEIFKTIVDDDYRIALRELLFAGTQIPDDRLPQYAATLEQLSLLDTFSVGILRELLPRLSDNWPSFSQENFLVMKKVLDSRIVWEDERGYKVHPTIATLYQRVLPLLDRPMVLKVHQTMIDVLTESIRRGRGNLKLLAEQLEYHKEQLRAVSSVS